MSAARTAAAAVLVLLALAPAASAHVTVAPSQVAPGSVVELAIRVPNERDVPTTKVEVQIPAGLEVFSFAELPGWTRAETEAADGTLQSVSWTGTLSKGSYVTFDLLASTPDQLGELTFKTVQTYEGGDEVAWIGAPDSDEPAPVVEVTADAASGAPADDGHDDETATGTDTAAASTAEAPATSAAEPATVPETATAAPDATEVSAPSVGVVEDDDDTPAATWVAVALGAAGLVAGVAALVVALRRRPGSGPPGGTPDAF